MRRHSVNNPSVQDVLDRFERYAKASNVLSSSERTDVFRLLECSKEFADRAYRRFVKENRNVPLLQSYQSDTTKVRMARRDIHGIDGVGKARTVVWETGDVLVERLFCAGPYRGQSQRWATLKPRDALRCHEGKDSWVAVGARQSHCPTLQQLGHQSIPVSHYVFDRALHSKLVRLIQAFHFDVLSRLFPQGGEATRKAWLKTLVIIAGCGLHDGHNALHWSLCSLGCQLGLFGGRVGQGSPRKLMIQRSMSRGLGSVS